jgi:proteasome assembly chaperone (PAC2) family protein
MFTNVMESTVLGLNAGNCNGAGLMLLLSKKAILFTVVESGITSSYSITTAASALLKKLGKQYNTTIIKTPTNMPFTWRLEKKR